LEGLLVGEFKDPFVDEEFEIPPVGLLIGELL